MPRRLGRCSIRRIPHPGTRPLGRRSESGPIHLKAGITDPVLFFIPSINPGNMVIYEAAKLPGWKGNILLGTMKLKPDR